MDLDKDKIKQRFAEINEAVASAKELPLSDDNEFWNRKSNIAALKYYLLQAIEAVGGVCVHVAAKKLNKGVSGFGECFELLGEEKILNNGLAQKMKKMSKFRNKLIHRYWEMEDKKILEYARKDITDFGDFMRSIDKIL
ncbi:TPA: DUF86 domain-containing protein [Patescibacteria group bacterium]|nr:MAG: hypothetical protein UT71_C0002G0020 [Parcubacteria group bacterium GW2011_GWF2_40_10]KKR47797.1 MAG: hypothetical protein UT83_C0003G0010 [Parcubacteria group bacterium GW2011_GWA2_40_143]KKR60228.1 MAG: hypothetical protein UT97_C0003G0010 [Parcubacteria group bacterium GW2011_GWC2_40_31]KKR75198.1 MAG: hypothetical protein UU18_C0011G0003 [Parcubacteria group bacterium GW2011_GWB2_40_8]KKR81752.1 MAG: hypothetical protein UU28_C0020G0004 [Parcubacteria group bacterium GW2011_GWD2_40_